MSEYQFYVLLFFVSTIVLFLLGIYSLRYRRTVDTAVLFSLQSVAMGVWTFCYAMELVSPTLEGKIVWAKMKYLGATTGPVLWFVFSLYYTNHRHWLTLPLRFLLGFFIFGTVAVVFTNELHHWHWTRIFLLPGFPETQSEHGFYFWVYAAGSYLLIFASVFIYVKYYPTVPVYFRKQSVLLVVGTFLPLGIRMLEDIGKWDPLPKVDNLILFLSISAVVYAVALFRFSALDIVPIAHNLIVRNINSGIIVLDVLGRVVEINPFAQRLIGPSAHTSIVKPIEEVIKDWPPIGYSIQVSEQHEQEISLQRDGEAVYFLVQISPIRNERHRMIGHVIVSVDITDRKQAEIELERLARTDVLTDVTNRRYFFELAEVQFARAQRYHQPLAVLLLDVDHFKQVNDRYGHLAGDQVLQMIARECQKHFRSSDIFARYGGEEFICLLPEQDQQGALESAERIRQIIGQADVVFEAQSICVTVSIGLAVLQTVTNLTLERLIDQADQALYASKTSGRNRVSVWQEI
jgi:diguanylate cyclase (GGDEF)-like protein/PAS domain S-box-containing protein